MQVRIVTVISLAACHRAFGGPSFLAVGDWGGDSDSVPATAAQIKTATAMGTVGAAMNASKVFLLGDNFYTDGVTSVDSSRFNDTFEVMCRVFTLSVI